MHSLLNVIYVYFVINHFYGIYLQNYGQYFFAPCKILCVDSMYNSTAATEV
jgi:hypothetical protein